MNHIFTDGACKSNGKQGAQASYATVLWSELEPITFAARVPMSEPQTNQRAELRGMEHAFQVIETLQGTITIWTDSEYVLKCITEWGPQWKARGWRRAANAKKPLEHLDLLKPLIDYYETNQHRIRIRHVRAHTNNPTFPYTGNALADKLATTILESS